MAGMRQLRELAAAARFSGSSPLDARRANRGSSDGDDSRPLSPDKQVRGCSKRHAGRHTWPTTPPTPPPCTQLKTSLPGRGTQTLQRSRLEPPQQQQRKSAQPGPAKVGALLLQSAAFSAVS